MILPGATIGIIGGGQLGQMLAQEAVSMGFSVVVLDPTPGCPASAVADQIVADYDDVQAVLQLARRSDVVTYEFENVDAGALLQASDVTLVPQGTRALETCQDRGAEKQFLTKAQVPVANYQLVDSAEELHAALRQVHLPSVLKTRRGGYDGKGQVVLKSGDKDALRQAEELAQSAGCVLEEWVPFEREISVVVARNSKGEIRCFPASRNEHRNNILHRSIVPAGISEETQESADQLASKIAEEMGLIGVMGVEMFALENGELLVNELAPRPHNSGHYTIEACDHSQYAAHVRAICGWPLPVPRLLSPAVMTNILGEDMDGALKQISRRPDWNYHLYGKDESKPGRKMGHITVLTDNQSEAF